MAFLNDRKLAVVLDGDDATITFSPFAALPCVHAMPPSLIPREENQIVICGYTSFHSGIVPITKCLVWDDTVRRGRFLIGFAVGERGFTKMPEGWMLEQGTERVCNEALAGKRWYRTERKAVEHAETLVYPFQVREMALTDQLPECLVDLDPPQAEGARPTADEEDEYQFLSFPSSTPDLGTSPH